jgi:hypothetical protein
VEDARLVRGAGRFLDDLEPVGGLLHAAVVRSPFVLHAVLAGALGIAENQLRFVIPTRPAERVYNRGNVAACVPDAVRRTVRGCLCTVVIHSPAVSARDDTARTDGET